MVGIFSRLSSGRHRRTQSAVDARETPRPNAEVTSSTITATASHGIEVAVAFKPVERPTEPLDHDQPVKCPLPEPSILNDGRIWKERMSAGARVRTDLPVVKEGLQLESENARPRPRLNPSKKHGILPSHSAPEHNFLKILEECNASGV